jgi:hypothetical protein
MGSGFCSREDWAYHVPIYGHLANAPFVLERARCLFAFPTMQASAAFLGCCVSRNAKAVVDCFPFPTHCTQHATSHSGLPTRSRCVEPSNAKVQLQAVTSISGNLVTRSSAVQAINRNALSACQLQRTLGGRDTDPALVQPSRVHKRHRRHNACYADERPRGDICRARRADPARDVFGR